MLGGRCPVSPIVMRLTLPLALTSKIVTEALDIPRRSQASGGSCRAIITKYLITLPEYDDVCLEELQMRRWYKR
jgi:hypothetical protein